MRITPKNNYRKNLFRCYVLIRGVFSLGFVTRLRIEGKILVAKLCGEMSAECIAPIFLMMKDEGKEKRKEKNARFGGRIVTDALHKSGRLTS